MLHWPQGRVAGLHVCKKGTQHSLTVACICVIDNSCLIAYIKHVCMCKWVRSLLHM